MFFLVINCPFDCFSFEYNRGQLVSFILLFTRLQQLFFLHPIPSNTTGLLSSRRSLPRWSTFDVNPCWQPHVIEMGPRIEWNWRVDASTAYSRLNRSCVFTLFIHSPSLHRFILLLSLFFWSLAFLNVLFFAFDLPANTLARLSSCFCAVRGESKPS